MRNLFALTPMMLLLAIGCGGSPTIDNPDARPAAVDGDPRPDALDPPSCTNGVKDGDEGDVDCGGSCAAKCGEKRSCNTETDCSADTDCNSDGACSGFDCPSFCLVNHHGCYAAGCSADEVCLDILISDDGGPAGYCHARHQPGEDCRTLDYDKDLNDCVDGYTCQEAESPFHDTCQVAPVHAVAHEGESCLNDPDCDTGLFCSNSYKCQRRGAVDEACFAGNIPCATGLQCDFPTGLACNDWVDCGSNMACCATATGSECRVGPFNQCARPSGSCRPQHN